MIVACETKAYRILKAKYTKASICISRASQEI